MHTVCGPQNLAVSCPRHIHRSPSATSPIFPTVPRLPPLPTHMGPAPTPAPARGGSGCLHIYSSPEMSDLLNFEDPANFHWPWVQTLDIPPGEGGDTAGLCSSHGLGRKGGSERQEWEGEAQGLEGGLLGGVPQHVRGRTRCPQGDELCDQRPVVQPERHQDKEWPETFPFLGLSIFRLVWFSLQNLINFTFKKPHLVSAT